MNPYISTYLNTVVRIHPSLMDNNIRKHIKASIEKDFTNKCFLDYGFVTKIHEIYPDYDAEVVPEDPMACALFKVKFLTTICRPILNSTIIAKIFAVTGPTIYLTNGPLDVLIYTTKNINQSLFVFNQRLNTWTVRKDMPVPQSETETETQKKFIVLKPGMYVKVKILNKKIIDKTDRILCSGYLDSIASEEDIKKSLENNSVVSRYESMQSYLDTESSLQKKHEEEQLKANLNVELTETEENDESEEEDSD
jgi:DNA-directed RNA polymerase subunit E'/Rpb7